MRISHSNRKGGERARRRGAVANDLPTRMRGAMTKEKKETWTLADFTAGTCPLLPDRHRRHVPIQAENSLDRKSVV